MQSISFDNFIDIQKNQNNEYIEQKNHIDNVVWTFAPEISKKSKKLTKNYHTNANNIGDILSQEKIRIDKEKAKIRSKSHKEECPFQPEIGELNRKVGYKEETYEMFLNRMTNSKKISEEALDSERIKQRFFEEQCDFKTGQQLFVPKISSYEESDKLNRKSQGYESVFHALYDEARILKDKRSNLNKCMKKHQEDLSKQYKELHVCQKSDAILLELHKRRLKDLFDKMDSDYDGLISAQKINIAELSNQLLDILTPLLLKIEEHSLVLNFEQFTEIVLEFSKILSIPDKNLLLGPERELYKSPLEEPTFTPMLTENTRAIMKFSNSKERKVKLWEDHRKRGSVDKENYITHEDVEEWTFHPQIISYNPDKFKSGIKSKMDLKETLIHTYMHK